MYQDGTMKMVIWIQSKEADCWSMNRQQQKRLCLLLPQWEVAHASSREEFLTELKDADAAASWLFRQEWFSQAEKLRFLKTPAAGLDYFSIDPPPGLLFEGSRFHGPIMAETAAAWILSHSRALARSSRHMAREEAPWDRRQLAALCQSARGSRVLLLGFGAIGKEIAKTLSALGCRIHAVKHSPLLPADYPDFFGPEDTLFYSKERPLRRILEAEAPETDHLFSVLPGYSEFDGLIDSSILSAMPKNAALYNIGRGKIVNEEELTAHLKRAPGFEAYLDVFHTEPLGAHPLRDVENAHLMPHISAARGDYLDCFIDELAERCRQLFS